QIAQSNAYYIKSLKELVTIRIVNTLMKMRSDKIKLTNRKYKIQVDKIKLSNRKRKTSPNHKQSIISNESHTYDFCMMPIYFNKYEIMSIIDINFQKEVALNDISRYYK